MSYLDLPRIHFHGTFFTNPSTINNDIDNMALGAHPGEKPDKWEPSWNPNGLSQFYFLDCQIGACVDTHDRALVAGTHDDPLLGARLETLDPYNGLTDEFGDETGYDIAKMVDIDTDLQLQDSALYGMWFFVRLPAGNGKMPVALYGRLGVPFLHNAAMTSLKTVTSAKSGINVNVATAGCWQTVIDTPKWPGHTDSRLLSMLRTHWKSGAVVPGGGISSGRLSVKFVVSLYNTDLANREEGNWFGYGRVTGTIGRLRFRRCQEVPSSGE